MLAINTTVVCALDHASVAVVGVGVLIVVVVGGGGGVWWW